MFRRGRGATTAHALLISCVALELAGCAVLASFLTDVSAPGPRTTFTKHLDLATAGNAESQNVVGYMLFFGEGVPRNPAQAHAWFRRAAAQGSARAERNLAVMHHLGAGAPKDAVEAELHFRRSREHVRGAGGADGAAMSWRTLDEFINAGLRQPDVRPAEQTYGTFCAGCHGLNGIAAYVASPSFALGERLQKSDAEMLGSLRRGIGTMPGWEDKLPPGELPALLRFVRGFPQEYEFGIARVLRPVPRLYFLFGPMRDRELAYRPRAD